jgi:hypothetical protein
MSCVFEKVHPVLIPCGGGGACISRSYRNVIQIMKLTKLSGVLGWVVCEENHVRV